MCRYCSRFWRIYWPWALLSKVSFGASYRAPGVLSAQTVTREQKPGFGALGDKWKIQKMKQSQLQPPHITQVNVPRRATTTVSPNRNDRQHGQRAPSGEVENSKNETATVTIPAHPSSPRTPPPPHLRIGTTGSMASDSPGAFAAHICYQILFYYTTTYFLVVEIWIQKLVHFYNYLVKKYICWIKKYKF